MTAGNVDSSGQAAQAAIDSVSLSRLIVDSAIKHAIMVLSPDGTLTGWSTGAEQVLGYRSDDILGRSADILLEPTDRDIGWLSSLMRRTIETGSAAHERWHLRQDGTRVWLTGVMTPIGARPGFLNILRDETEAHAELEHRRMLMAEMNHRIKNTFTVVQAMAHSTRRYASSVQDFQVAFDSRLLVMARSHDMLMRTDWRDAELREVIAGVLEPFDTEPGRMTLAGVRVLLPSNLVIAVSLALHELATNAVKHGSLSVAGGRVAVTWTADLAGPDGPRVEIIWLERGGPAVEPPVRGGFGSKLFRMGLPLNGSVKLDFQPAGVECRMVLLLGPTLP